MPNEGIKQEVEWGWRLKGIDGAGVGLDMIIGETDLANAATGITVGRHPDLSELVIDDPSLSRRHFRLSRGKEGVLIEDLHSLNGTHVDGRALAPFEPISARDGQRIVAGRVRLTLTRLAEPTQ